MAERSQSARLGDIRYFLGCFVPRLNRIDVFDPPEGYRERINRPIRIRLAD